MSSRKTKIFLIIVLIINHIMQLNNQLYLIQLYLKNKRKRRIRQMDIGPNKRLRMSSDIYLRYGNNDYQSRFRMTENNFNLFVSLFDNHYIEKSNHCISIRQRCGLFIR